MAQFAARGGSRRKLYGPTHMTQLPVNRPPGSTEIHWSHSTAPGNAYKWCVCNSHVVSPLIAGLGNSGRRRPIQVRFFIELADIAPVYCTQTAATWLNLKHLYNRFE